MARGTWQGFAFYWLPVIVYVILILTLSSIPRLGPPFHFPNSDKLVHVMEYSILGFLLTRALRTIPRLNPVATAGWLAVLCGSAVGAFDEVYQQGTPGRESSPFDWMADTLGVTLDTVKIRLHRARARLRKDLGEGCDFYRDDRNEFACDPKPAGVSRRD